VTGDRDAGTNIDAALLERTPDDVRYFGVATRENRRQCLEDRDGGSHVGEQRRELTPNGTAADDRRRRRQG